MKASSQLNKLINPNGLLVNNGHNSSVFKQVNIHELSLKLFLIQNIMNNKLRLSMSINSN